MLDKILSISGFIFGLIGTITGVYSVIWTKNFEHKKFIIEHRKQPYSMLISKLVSIKKDLYYYKGRFNNKNIVDIGFDEFKLMININSIYSSKSYNDLYSIIKKYRALISNEVCHFVDDETFGRKFIALSCKSSIYYTKKIEDLINNGYDDNKKNNLLNELQFDFIQELNSLISMLEKVLMIAEKDFEIK